MYSIPEMAGDNLGGIFELFFTEQSNIQEFPIAQNLLIETPIILKPGKFWFQIKFTTGTAGLNEEENQEPHGQLYEQEISGFRAQDSQLVGLAWQAMGNRKIVCLVRDANNVIRVAGDEEDFLLLKRKFSTGNKPADRNGSEFTFKGKSSHPAYYYTAAMPAGSIPSTPTGNPANPYPELPLPQYSTIVDGKGNILAQVPTGGFFEITSGFTFGYRIL